MQRNPLTKHWKVILLGFILLGSTACSIPGLAASSPTAVPDVETAATETASPVPSATIAPPTETPESNPVLVLSSKEINKEVEDPKYLLQISYPFIENGGENGEVFNQAIQAQIDTQISQFIQSAQEVEDWRKETLPEAENSLYISYTTTNSSHDLVSIKFDVSVYTAGAAHPNPYSIVYNFDLSTGKQLSMEDLFLLGSDYLRKISDYCINELQNNEYVFPDFQQYAQPTADNYRNWNIQQGGILITFDVYQVAPYVAGPQLVEVPYEVLRDQIGPESPLNAFLN